MKNNFNIPQSKADTIFETTLFPLISRGVEKEEVKSAYIVGGQPGSGKSAFAQSLMSKNKQLVFINGDDLRVYHPEYVKFLKENDQEAADKTQAICNYWIERAIDKCIENNLSFLVEGTMRTVQAPLNTSLKAKENGYEVKVCVIAAPYELSLASINYRYSEAKRLEGYARYTKKESHDEAFNNIPMTVGELMSKDVFSKLFVYKRLDGKFESHKVEKENKEKILSLLQEGRERVLTEKEIFFVRENSNLDGHPFPII